MTNKFVKAMQETNKTTPKGAELEKRIRKQNWLLIGITVLFAGILLAVVIYGLSSLNKSMKEESYIKSTSSYHDNYLNFSMDIPNSWEVRNPEPESVKEAVVKATGGLVFDIMHNVLNTELVPLALVHTPKGEGLSEDARKKGMKFLTLAIRGSDKDYSYLRDNLVLMDNFKEMLTNLEFKDVKILEASSMEGKSNNNGLWGTMIKATAVQDGVAVNYLQYFEAVGNNILIVTYGSSASHNEGIKEIGDLLNTLVFHEGAVILDEESKEELSNKPLPEQQGSLTPLVEFITGTE